jgi:hypothetical protein
VSWYQYLDIRKAARAEFEYWASNPPLACSRCGEPLIPAPQTAEVTLLCRNDGWAYPRDFVRPQIL